MSEQQQNKPLTPWSDEMLEHALDQLIDGGVIPESRRDDTRALLKDIAALFGDGSCAGEPALACASNTLLWCWELLSKQDDIHHSHFFLTHSVISELNWQPSISLQDRADLVGRAVTAARDHLYSINPAWKVRNAGILRTELEIDRAEEQMKTIAWDLEDADRLIQQFEPFKKIIDSYTSRDMASAAADVAWRAMVSLKAAGASPETLPRMRPDGDFTFSQLMWMRAHPDLGMPIHYVPLGSCLLLLGILLGAMTCYREAYAIFEESLQYHIDTGTVLNNMQSCMLPLHNVSCMRMLHEKRILHTNSLEAFSTMLFMLAETYLMEDKPQAATVCFQAVSWYEPTTVAEQQMASNGLEPIRGSKMPRLGERYDIPRTVSKEVLDTLSYYSDPARSVLLSPRTREVLAQTAREVETIQTIAREKWHLNT